MSKKKTNNETLDNGIIIRGYSTNAIPRRTGLRCMAPIGIRKQSRSLCRIDIDEVASIWQHVYIDFWRSRNTITVTNLWAGRGRLWGPSTPKETPEEKINRKETYKYVRNMHIPDADNPIVYYRSILWQTMRIPRLGEVFRQFIIAALKTGDCRFGGLKKK